MKVPSVVILTHHLLTKRPLNIGVFAAYLIVILLSSPTAIAQVVIGARPGLISFVVGDVFVDGKAVSTAGQNYPALNEGQVVRTDYGRVEILLAPAVFLRLGEWGALRLIRRDPEDTQVELQKGSALVEVAKKTRDHEIQILCAATRTEFKSMGVYRFDADPPILRVLGGNAKVSSAEKKINLGSKRAINLGNVLSISKFSIDSTNDFNMWAALRSFSLGTGNWRMTAPGYFVNQDFHVRIYSPEAARQRSERLRAENEAKAVNTEGSLLRAVEEEDRRAIQEQQQRDQQQQAQQPQGQQPPPQANKKP